MESKNRIFIVGGGPSLLTQDLRPLADKTTFSCNRICLWEERPFKPTYYACSANAVIRDIEPIDPPVVSRRFIVSRRRDQLEGWDGWDAVYKKEKHGLLMPGDTELLVQGGSTMSGIMIQLAAWMGYDEMYLLGVEQRGGGHVFDPDSQSKYTYVIADEDKLFNNWRNIKETYEAIGVSLRDCTPNGRLNDILGYAPFEKVVGDYASQSST